MREGPNERRRRRGLMGDNARGVSGGVRTRQESVCERTSVSDRVRFVFKGEETAAAAVSCVPPLSPPPHNTTRRPSMVASSSSSPSPPWQQRDRAAAAAAQADKAHRVTQQNAIYIILYRAAAEEAEYRRYAHAHL